MVNVVIIKKNKKDTQKFTNDLLSLNESVEKIYTVCCFKELYNLLSIQKIDFIIMNFDIYYSLTIEEYIKVREKVKNIISVNFKTNEIIKNINNIHKNNNKQSMILEISKIINISCQIIDENKLKTIISQKLFSIEYSMKYKGTKYIIEATFIAKVTGYYDLDKIEKTIYTKVAQIYNTTVHNVKCNIINATNSMYYSCEEDKLKTFLRTNEIYKPGPKAIISAILNEI